MPMLFFGGALKPFGSAPTPWWTTMARCGALVSHQSLRESVRVRGQRSECQGVCVCVCVCVCV